MQYRNNNTGLIVTAYQIGSVMQGADNYAISLPEIAQTIGLYPSQTVSYIPQIGDFYVDMGDIASSFVVNQTDFLLNYTQV